MTTNSTLQPELIQRFHNVIEELGPEQLKQMLQDMHTIRAFEERAEQLYSLGKVHGTMHLSIGQEATAVGAANALQDGDYLLNHHRGHGHCLAWGSDVNRMMAEFTGKETGFCRGRGGSMHIADVDANNLGANGIVAGGVPISTGVGLSIKMRKTSQVCMVIFGDGAANEGALHEALNMASIWDLPVIFLCENNQYAMSMPMPKAFNIEKISDRAAGYGIPGETVDGNEVLAVYEAVKKAADRARRGEGPSLIESVTYRYKGHSKSDKQAYRTRDEVNDWMENRDPIKRFGALLTTAGITSEAEATGMRDVALGIIDRSVEFSDNSPTPDVAGLMEGVYA
ncbi:MAG TPA: thiamine pyrophosphate-dependent dehydrogenase E1 component subunit alpha [Aggregatilineales bacterium]|nr:thiamine pyrophosphate-dependent dehydrogenase E1 component subunit alpha [Anaerolineae bacterium]HUN06541.1 thiamine pyrophosphate-dependent dehydrogenase E1 component subunit alpha [Aggregatilineales bacterium]